MAKGKSDEDPTGFVAGGLSKILADVEDIPEPSDAELAALEKELLEGDEEEDGAEDDPLEASGAGLEALLAALVGSTEPRETPEEPAGHVMTPSEGAQRLLEFMLQREELELEPGHEPEELASKVAALLEVHEEPAEQARALSAFLLSQDAVAELYLDDGALEQLLAQW